MTARQQLDQAVQLGVAARNGTGVAGEWAVAMLDLISLVEEMPAAPVKPAYVRPAPQTCQQWFDSEDEKAAAPRFKRGVVVLR